MATQCATPQPQIIGFYEGAPLKPKRFRQELASHQAQLKTVKIGDASSKRCPLCHAKERVTVEIWKGETCGCEYLLCVSCGWASMYIPRYEGE